MSKRPVVGFVLPDEHFDRLVAFIKTMDPTFEPAKVEPECVEDDFSSAPSPVLEGRLAAAREVACIFWDGRDGYCTQEGSDPQTCACYRLATAVLKAAGEADRAR
jgi:hypothetical protein